MSSVRLLETARAAAAAAAAVHRRHLRSFGAEAWAEKGWADFVTHVDREAEAVIIDRIRADFPGHAVLAEEASTAPGGSPAWPTNDWIWVVDPLDGTTNYLHAYPMYAVSIAVLRHGDPIAGVVLNTASGDEWCATRGGGAFWNGTPVRVSSIRRMEQALIGTGFPFKVQHFIPEYLVQLGAVLRVTSGVRAPAPPSICAT
jgi:myo-inositol-1(or 4)-monophosphatase